MSVLASALDQTRDAERRSALRALLAHPVLAAHGPGEADYRRVRRFEDELRDWLETNTGWRLTVDSSCARLHKHVRGTDPTRGLVDSRRRPFTRRRYVLLALTVATLERAATQITLGWLAEQVIVELGDKQFVEAGIDFTLTGRDERGDIVAVVRLLLSLGALRRVEGDEERFVASGTDVLYDVEHGVVATLLQTARAPSMVQAQDFSGRLAAIVDQPFTETDEARNRAIRHGLTRRLLDDPVVEYASLDDAELAYLTKQRHAITDRITEATGLVPEIRAEGIAMLDPDDALTDVRMPEGGAPGHLALLIATRLAADKTMTRDELVAHTDELCTAHSSIWGSTIRSRPRTELADEALARLRALGLVRVGPDGIEARPILARFRLAEPRIEGSLL